MRRTAACRRRTRGTTLVETALVLSLLCLFLFGIFEYGRYLLVTQMLANAARDGVRYAATNVDKSNNFVTVDEGGRTNITDYVKQECRGVDKMVSDFQVKVYPCDNTTLYANPPVIQPKASYTAWNSASFTERLAVEITAKYKPVLPVVWLPGSGGSGFKVSFYNYDSGGNTVHLKIAAASGSEG
jgi:Flp pilus assembly protein TadG